MKKFLKLVFLIAWMGLIFYFSSQPALDSENTSNLVSEIIYKIYAFVLVNVEHLSESEFMNLYVQPIRKLAHFTEFMVLGILSYINIEEYKKDKIFIYALLFSGLYAISDEIHQLFVLNRYCSIKDMLIDISGSLLGISICHLIKKRWKKS